MIKIIKADETTKEKKYSLKDKGKAVKELSGVWKDRWGGKTTNEIVDIIRKMAWRSHAY